METVENKENKFFIMDNFYGNFAINKIFERMATGFSEYREKNSITGDTTGLQFKSYYADLYIDARMIYSLLVYSFLVEYSIEKDEEHYNRTLFDVTARQAEVRKRSFEILSGIKWKNEKEIEVRKRIAQMFSESLGIYTNLTKKTSEVERIEIIQKVVERFNKYSKELDMFIKLQENIPIETKISKLFEKINEIFIDDINVELGYDLNKLDIKSYLFLMLKDAVTLILLQLLFENTISLEQKSITFDSEKWYLYFLMVIFEEYKENGVNLLRLNKKSDFLKFGAKLSDTFMMIRKFFGLQKYNFGNEISEEFSSFPHKIFYLLLGYGASLKEKYILPERKNESSKLEFFMSDIINRNEKKQIPFTVSVTGKNFRIQRMTEMLALSEVSAESVQDFRLMFKSALQEYQDSFVLGPENLEESLRNAIESGDEEIVDDWLALKEIAEKMSVDAKREMLKEFVSSLLDKGDNFSRKIAKKAESLTEFIKSLSKESETEIQKNRMEIIGKRIFLTNNFFSPERINALKLLEKLEKTEYLSKEAYEKDFKKYLTLKDKELKFEEYKPVLIERIKKETRKKILINTGFDFDNSEHPLERYNVYQRVFFMISVYEKVWKNNEMEAGNFIKEYNDEKLEKLFHSLITDIAMLISSKEENEFIARNIVIEEDYMEELSKKMEKYFSFSFLSKEKIELLEEIEKEEGKKYLSLFKKALECGYYFFTNPWEEIRKRQNVALQRKRATTDEDEEELLLSKEDYFENVLESIDPETLFG